MTRRATLGAGLLLGLLMGGWDAVAVVLENPRSFPDLLSAALFFNGAMTLSALAGLMAAAVLAALPRRPGSGGLAALPRQPASGGRALWPCRPGTWIVAAGIGLGAFAWLGVRVHVKWFFGVPVTEPIYAIVNLLLLLGCGGLAWLIHRWIRAGLERRLESRWIVGVAGLFAAVAAGLFVITARPSAAYRDGHSAAEGARDVLLVTWDTTRSDHLSTYGYPRGTTPALDRVARRGVLWTDLWAPIPLTNPSHSSLLTGLLPREHGVRNNGTPLPDRVDTVVPELASQGWQCAAFVSGIPLKAGLSGLAPGFAVYDDVFSPLEKLHPMLATLAAVRVANRVLPIDVIERRASHTAQAAINWLGETRGPRFLWVHFFDPHTPYDAAPEYLGRFSELGAEWTAHGVPAHQWPAADYDAELRATDRAMNRLLHAFDQATAGQGVVILTADHGEGLGQHGELAHGAQLFAEDLRVPGIVQGIDRLRGLRTGLASTTGIGRLVLMGAGAELPIDGPFAMGLPDAEASNAGGLDAEVPGGVAVGTEAPDTEPPFDPLRTSLVMLETFAPEGKEDQSAVLHDSGRKVMVNWATGEEHGFDLKRDPGETASLPVDEVALDLRKFLTSPSEGDAEGLDPEVVRRLRALGYLH